MLLRHLCLVSSSYWQSREKYFLGRENIEWSDHKLGRFIDKFLEIFIYRTLQTFHETDLFVGIILFGFYVARNAKTRNKNWDF